MSCAHDPIMTYDVVYIAMHVQIINNFSKHIKQNDDTYSKCHTQNNDDGLLLARTQYLILSLNELNHWNCGEIITSVHSPV